LFRLWHKNVMIDRRVLLAATLAALPVGAMSASPGWLSSASSARLKPFASFLLDVRSQASQLGVSREILDVALALDRPDARVLELDRHQLEFTLTWNQYRQRVLTDQKIQAARTAYQSRLSLLTGVWERYHVDPRIAVGIWGLESNYGSRTGSFGVIDSLATLAFDGRRAAFFRTELLDALRILQQRDIEPSRMLGSYAGAMGQPQFMPSSYARYAVDYDRDGRRDIWSSEADVLASIANYLSQNGWTADAPWGQAVSVPPGLDLSLIGRKSGRLLGDWMRIGVRRADGTRFSRHDVSGVLLLPDGAAGDAFMVYDNFDVIRRYNPSDFYSLAVGLLGSATA